MAPNTCVEEKQQEKASGGQVNHLVEEAGGGGGGVGAMTTTPSLNAAASFKAGVLDLERGMGGADGKRSCVACFGRQNSMHSLGRASHAQMSGKKILKALSSFSCISSKSISLSNSSSKRESQDLEDLVANMTPAFDNKPKSDQRILLRIVMWGGPNTLLLIAPFDAAAEEVIEMVLESYVKGVNVPECQDFALFCYHCDSPALHPKQKIGSVGSRHFLLCKKGPDYLNGSSQAVKHFHSSGGHSRSHSYAGSTDHSFRSLSRSNSSLSSTSSTRHGRSQSWWNVKCLSMGGEN